MNNRRRRFKRTILWMLATLVLVQTTLAVLIETRLTAVRDPEYAEHEQRWRERISEHGNCRRVLFLGSSRVACGIDAGGISKHLGIDTVAFNFGISKTGPFGQRVYLERLTEKHLLPDVAVIEVMIPFLHGNDLPFEERGLDGERLALGELAELPISRNVRGAYRKWLFHRFAPVQTCGSALWQPPGSDDVGEVDPYGWRASGLPSERLASAKALAHRQYDECYQAFRIHPVQAKRVHDLIVRCRELGIVPIVLLMPEGSEFRNRLSFEGEANLRVFLNELRNRHATAVIDARAWMADDAFIDMHHLKGQEAIRFSERLGRAAIGPYLRSLSFASRR